jgi:hypothetical protein
MSCYVFDEEALALSEGEGESEGSVIEADLMVSWDSDNEKLKVTLLNGSIPAGSTIKLTFSKDDFPIT